MTPAVALVVTGGGAATRCAAASLFPAAEHHVFGRDELRPAAPFSGRLFELVAARAAGECVGLVVPVAWRAPASGVPAPVAELLAVADHVNLELRGPLTGPWPDRVPRTFPVMTGVYQPAVVRGCGGPQVYSGGVVVAGVADAARLTPFEAGAVREQGLFAFSDTLVPAAIIAAYYGLTVAACGVPLSYDNDDE